MTFAPLNSKTAYLSTAEVFPQDQDDLLVKLTNVYTNVANTVNIREIAIYEAGLAILTGQQFSIPGTNNTKKIAFRKVFYFGAINIGAILLIPHGINVTDINQFTHIYGTCITSVVDYRPIPYIGPTNVNDQIVLLVRGTDIIIFNGTASVNITSGTIVLEYLLN